MELPDATTPEPERELVNPVPFVVALIAFAVVATLAIVFLRDDSGERVVRPDRLRRIDDTTVSAEATQQSTCVDLVRAQVDLTDSQVFLELVVRDADGPCTDATGTLRAEVTLPEPIGDRRLLAGAGRTPLPCEPSGSGFRCAPGR